MFRAIEIGGGPYSIDWADMVVACMDGPDPDSGTAWECGYAHVEGKPSNTDRLRPHLADRHCAINRHRNEATPNNN